MSSLGWSRPEALCTFHHGGEENLRLSAHFIVGAQRASNVLQVSSLGCRQLEALGTLHRGGASEPETLCTFHRGGAQSLRRSPNIITGVQMGVQSLRLSARVLTRVQRA